MVFFRFLRNSLGVLRRSIPKSKDKEAFMGVDQYGNNYYEIPADPSLGVKRVRRVDPIDPDVTKVPTLPVEWTTWLQGRRANPPSQKEIEENYLQMMKVKHRASKLESEAQELEPGTSPDETSLSLPPNEQTKPAAGFPKYDDYEIEPGYKKDNR